MLNFDPAFRQLLLAHHLRVPLTDRSLKPKLPVSGSEDESSFKAASARDQAEDGSRGLTHEILDQYESLVGHSFTLRRALFGEFKQPDSKTPSFRAQAVTNELQQVTNEMDAIRKNHMPDFEQVYAAWFARRKSVELGNANRAFKKPWQRTSSEKGGLSGFFRGMIVAVLIGFISIPFLAGDKIRDNGPVVFNPPGENAPESSLNAAEQQLLQKWHNAAGLGNTSYLDGLVHGRRKLVKSVGEKLLKQAELWQKSENYNEVDRRLAWVYAMGTVLTRVWGDEALLRQANERRRQLPVDANLTHKTNID
ncbi:MAG: hypothetical protein ACE5HO_14880 [bacterium]